MHRVRGYVGLDPAGLGDKMSYRDFWKTITTGTGVYNGATPDAARWQRLKTNRRLLPALGDDGPSFWRAVGDAKKGGRLSQEQYMNMNQPDLTQIINDAFGRTVNGRSWIVQMVLDSPDSSQALVKELIFVTQDMNQPFSVGIASLPWHRGSRRFSPR